MIKGSQHYWTVNSFSEQGFSSGPQPWLLTRVNGGALNPPQAQAAPQPMKWGWWGTQASLLSRALLTPRLCTKVEPFDQIQPLWNLWAVGDNVQISEFGWSSQNVRCPKSRYVPRIAPRPLRRGDHTGYQLGGWRVSWG